MTARELEALRDLRAVLDELLTPYFTPSHSWKNRVTSSIVFGGILILLIVLFVVLL